MVQVPVGSEAAAPGWDGDPGQEAAAVRRLKQQQQQGAELQAQIAERRAHKVGRKCNKKKRSLADALLLDTTPIPEPYLSSPFQGCLAGCCARPFGLSPVTH